MGCGCPPKTLEKVLKYESSKEIDLDENNDRNPLFLFYQKLQNLIEKNPFYEISLTHFKNTFISIKNKIEAQDKKENTNYNCEIIDEIIKAFFKDENNFLKELFNKVVNYALINYNFGINQENNKHLIEIIIELIYIFLSSNQAGKKDLFKKNMVELLKNINENKDDNNYKFKKENIFNFIINMIEIHTFFFINFFLYFTFSEIIINEYDNYEKIIKEDSAINDIKTFVESKLNLINKNLSVDYLNILIISELNNKIKSCFELENEGDIIALDDEKINLISDSIYEIININNYTKFIFFGENRNF